MTSYTKLSLSSISNDTLVFFYSYIVEDNSADIFLPQAEPDPWVGKTIHESFKSFNFCRESNRYDANISGVKSLLDLFAKSGLPESPKNKVSPVKTNSSSPATMHIDSIVCPGVLMIFNFACPRFKVSPSLTWVCSN